MVLLRHKSYIVLQQRTLAELGTIAPSGYHQNAYVCKSARVTLVECQLHDSSQSYNKSHKLEISCKNRGH